MKLELESASNFLVHILRLRQKRISETQLSKFNRCLVDEMKNRYRKHWYPEEPQKDRAYRTIQFYGKEETITACAGKKAGIKLNILNESYLNLMIWIDPFEVCYRIGENNSICILYEYNRNNPFPWSPIPTLTKKVKNQTNSKLNNKISRFKIQFGSYFKNK